MGALRRVAGCSVRRTTRGAGCVGVEEDGGNVEHFRRHFDAVVDVGKLAMSVAIPAQVSSRGGHLHPVRRQVADDRLLKTSTFHGSAGLMDVSMLKAISVICGAIPMSSTSASSVGVM